MSREKLERKHNTRSKVGECWCRVCVCCFVWPFWVKAIALLSLPTAFPCAFHGFDLHGACLSAGGVSMASQRLWRRHSTGPDLGGYSATTFADFVVTGCTNSTGQTQGVCTSLDLSRLNCRNDRGRTWTRLDLQGV